MRCKGIKREDSMMMSCVKWGVVVLLLVRNEQVKKGKAEKQRGEQQARTIEKKMRVATRGQ